MSYVKEKTIFEKIKLVRSLKSFGQNFLLNTMAGQKFFLYNTKLPRVINISFNEHTCMFKCKICPYSQDEIRDIYKDIQEMDFETLKNIVKSVPNDSYYSFDISSIGETLEFRDLAKFIKYMKEEKPLINTIISTNGLLLDEKRSKELIDSGLDNIQLSLFSGDKDEHKFITQSETYERIKNNIQNFQKIRDSKKSDKPFIQTFMIETKENTHLKDSFIEEWSKYVDKAFVRPMYKMGYTIDGMTPSYKETQTKERYPCISPWYSTAIRSNGDILACYMFHWHKDDKESMVMGNINENTLSQIYQSEKINNFREKHTRMELCDLETCQNCNLWDAYTNIWDKEKDIFEYKGIKIVDFFTPTNDYRGG